MPLLIGTDRGLFAYDLSTDSGPTSKMDSVHVRQLQSRPNGPTIYAATMSGLFASLDQGKTWMDLDVPHDQIASVFTTPDDRFLFAGTQPAHVYRSVDDGHSWTQCETFDQLPGKENWKQLGRGGPQVRDMTAHPRAPGKLFVAVEAEGVYVSVDYGDTWDFRSYGLYRDPHGLEMLGQDTVVAACGRGLYRTTDAGRSWQRVDTHRRSFWFSYFREAITHDKGNTVYTSGEDRAAARFDNSDQGMIFASTDEGTTWQLEEFPGHERDYVNAWATAGEVVVGGTVNGRLLRGPGEWEVVTTLDSTITSLVFTN
jgi:photosystem II stability/assembly factor-like uncharacterized protein